MRARAANGRRGVVASRGRAIVVVVIGSFPSAARRGPRRSRSTGGPGRRSAPRGPSRRGRWRPGRGQPTAVVRRPRPRRRGGPASTWRRRTRWRGARPRAQGPAEVGAHEVAGAQVGEPHPQPCGYQEQQAPHPSPCRGRRHGAQQVRRRVPQPGDDRSCDAGRRDVEDTHRPGARAPWRGRTTATMHTATPASGCHGTALAVGDSQAGAPRVTGAPGERGGGSRRRAWGPRPALRRAARPGGGRRRSG